MKFLRLRHLGLFFLPLVIISLISCGGEREASSSSPSTPPTNPPPAPPPNNPVDETAFKVELNVDPNYSAFLHVDGSMAAGCEIDKDAAASTVLDCIIDINEGDAYIQPASININSPSGMCNITTWDNSWYYNFETGFGPSSISIETRVDTGNNNAFVSRNCTVDYPFSAAEGPVACDASNFTELSFLDGGSGEATCIYDYTDNELPNCCFGNYTLTQTTVDDTTSAIVDTNTQEQSWGTTNYEPCLGGSGAKDGSWPKTAVGIPARQNFATWDSGINQDYTFPRPIEVHAGQRTVLLANWFTAGSHDHNPDPGGPSAAEPTSVVPVAADPIEDQTLDPLPTYSSQITSHVFGCRDAAYDIIHEIRLSIREWNTYAQYLAFLGGGPLNDNILNPGMTAADRGTEGINCDNTNSSTSIFCNDFFDWDDHGATYPAEADSPF